MSEYELIGIVGSHGEPTSLNPEAREALAYAGLAMYSVPRDDISALRAAVLSPDDDVEPAPPERERDDAGDDPIEQAFVEPVIRPAVGVESVLFCDEGSTWREVAASPITQDQSVIRRSGYTRTVPGGRHNLLLRCWAMPIEEIRTSGTWSASLRIEVVPQHVPSERRSLTTREPLMGTGVAQRGELYSESGFSFDAKGPEAFVIVLDQAALSRIDPERSQGTRSTVLWPRFADAPSVGQVLLDLRDSAGRTTPRVVVLIPHVPAEYSLIPRG